jgi:hypothetical protein
MTECDRPALYSEHFGDPRFSYVIVVSSLPGPFGQVRQISVNGNHRSMAFAALECPVVLAEVDDFRPPYRITYNESDDDWGTTREFLKWQEDRGALRMSSCSVVRSGPYVELRIADASVPWLAASPREALAALDAYERFWGQKLEHVGGLDVVDLRKTWRSASRIEVRKPLFVRSVSTKTLVEPPRAMTKGSNLEKAPGSLIPWLESTE